uniref:leucine-rich repeat-containing protein 20 isoform X2 n=1 Tax=Myxine glutinosa TaxID=7769 RepID=UPI00358EFF25
METWDDANVTEEQRQMKREVGQSVARVAVKIRQSVEDGRCLDLSDCKLICIPDAVFKMMRAVCAHVQVARLNCNELTSLSVRFINTFSKLQELVLQGNRLQRLPDEVARMPRLIYIDLSRNKFQEFPEVVTHSSSLQKICLTENSIRGNHRVADRA